jgi:SAM-dependent methyltransferase
VTPPAISADHLDATWPCYEFRHPSKTDPAYLLLNPLAKLLREHIAREIDGRRDLVIGDIGCGFKPYLPFFGEHARRYVGLDYEPHAMCDVACKGESLPIQDGAFDVVICTQVLEHAEDPARLLRECHRVCRPGGALLLSTHGVFLYHPHPQDFWRWTHSGLRRIVSESASFRHVEVFPSGGPCTCLFALVAQYANFWFVKVPRWGWRLKCVILRNTSNYVLNSLGEILDSGVGQTPEAPPRLVANYLVVARK